MHGTCRNAMITVEAAFIIPVVSLVIIMMIYKTVELYNKVCLFSEECIEEANEASTSADEIRLMETVDDIFSFETDSSENSADN